MECVTWESGSVVLAGQNIYLRDFRAADWPAVHVYAADPVVVEFMTWGPNTIEQSMSFVAGGVLTAQEQPRTRFELAVVRCSDMEVIGGAGIYLKQEQEGTAEIGYCLRRDVWGRGYATEAARLLVHFGFTHLGLHRIYATCDPRNRASARVLEKVGMQKEGYMRGHMRLRTGWRDSYLYAMIDTDPRM